MRCIICSRLKAPAGHEVPADLDGMRCSAAACAGYALDPRPGHLWPIAERRVRPGAGTSSAPGPVADVADALGRALCAHYFAGAAESA